MTDPSWTVVARMAGGLRRLMESIEYSMPPLDDLDFDMKQAYWYLDRLHAEIRRLKQQEKTNVVRLALRIPSLITGRPRE